MVTKFGKFCRNLRMDHEELLYDMAGRLGVSSAFLSRVETGKAKPPVEWGNVIASEYHLSETQSKELYESINEARENVIRVDSFSQNDREMMFAFARQLKDIDNEEKDRWRKMLKM